jgi:transposase
MDSNSNRTTFGPDYGRRGKLWVHGAFEPATGQAVTLLSPGRDSASHVQLLEKIMAAFLAERWLIIEDNLSIHISKQTKLALAAWSEMQLQFIPKYACWLNLIEPWWKHLRSVALKGRRFKNLDQLTQALNDALDYWNIHNHPYSWKKRPQEQVTILGGFCVQFRSDNLAIY